MTARLRIGRIAAAAGLKGEVKLYHYSGERERIADIKEIFLVKKNVSLPPDAHGDSDACHPAKVTSIRYAGATPILRVEGVDTRDEAEALIGADVYADKDALAPLGDDAYYVEDITGMTVTDRDGAELGVVAGVINNPAHDILRVSSGDGPEMLLPMVDAFVTDIDAEAGIIRANPPDGLAPAKPVSHED